MDRRSLIRALGGAIVAAAALPKLAWAAWSSNAMKAGESTAAMNELFGTADVVASAEVKLKAPEIAENGAVVPLEVSTDMPAEQIAIFVDKNPSPLVMTATMGAGATGLVKTRVRMGESSNVVAVVKSGGKLYSASQEVKVTIGGCGG
ncbi:MAG: thiosulfate oxidation carrier protein SoxY [Litorivicinus sp.]